MKTIMKKILVTLAVFSAVFGGVSALSSEPAYAASGFEGSCRDFLGLTSWDCNVKITNQDNLKKNVWLIAANIAADVAVLAAYLVLGYVIYGGYQYVFSAGDPGKVLSARKTLAHAFIGLAITMSASVIMKTIRIALVAGDGNIGACDPTTGAGCIEPTDMVANVISWTVGVVGIVAAVFVVYGGISYITSRGEPNKLIKARQTILYALIGLVVCAIAEIITAWVSGTIREANASVINYNIVKELHETSH